MSDLQRSFAISQLAKLPSEPPASFDEQDEDDDEISKLPLESPVSDSSSSASSTGTIVPSPGRKLFERPKGSTTNKNKSIPLPWTDFFAQELFFPRTVGSLSISHHAYISPPMLNGPLFVTHHGAGSSGLSFATLTTELQKILPKTGVLSLDARGHGSTTITTSDTNKDDEPLASNLPVDLSLPTLSSDLVYVLNQALAQLSLPTTIPIILIGHSLGGAVVADVAYRNLLPNPSLGYAVLDVVEGSAMEALASMSAYLASRPKSFPSIPAAIDWHTRSRTIRNTTSARVSVPPLLKPNSLSPSPSSSFSSSSPSTDQEIAQSYTWLTDLPSTSPHWASWFTDLSHKFLSPRGPAKLLLLAGTDRLDKPLTIGQMQGKFQLSIFPDAGHFLHEDQPARCAGVLADFYRRNDRGSLVLPPKVADLIAAGKLPAKGSG